MKITFIKYQDNIIKTFNTYKKKYDKIFIITDDNIINHYPFIKKLSDFILLCKNGESCKSILEYEKAILFLHKNDCNKQSVIIAIGGGTITDFAGFLSSTYMRGICYISIPTTLLGMVDASIGGKNALNFSNTRNLIGTFKNPEEVVIELNFLKTLDKEELVNGFAEIIKYSLIMDIELFKYLEKNIDKTFPIINAKIIKPIIKKCIKNKLDIVNKDYNDTNIRNILNFGHTVGHALESYYHFQLSHGKAVIYGMIISTYLSNLNKEQYKKINSLFKIFKLPNLKPLNKNKVMKYINMDKKNIANELNYIVLNKIGSAKIEKNFNKELIENSLDIL